LPPFETVHDLSLCSGSVLVTAVSKFKYVT